MDETMKSEATEEVVEEAAETTGWFKTFIAKTKEWFKSATAWAKNAWETVTNKIANSKIGTSAKEKIQKIFGNVAEEGQNGLNTMKDTGLLGTAAEKGSKLAKKFFEKIKDFLGRHKIIRGIAKILCAIVGIAFAAVVVFYIIKMLPAIICGVAEIIAAAFIIYGLFFIIDTALGKGKEAE